MHDDCGATIPGLSDLKILKCGILIERKGVNHVSERMAMEHFWSARRN